MDKPKFSFAFTYKVSHIYGKAFLKSFNTLLYFSSHLQKYSLAKAISPDGSISIQYIDGLLVESDTKDRSKPDSLSLLQSALHRP